MGLIHDDARDSFFSKYPNTESLFRRLLSDFDITWAAHRRAFGSDFVQVFAKPAAHITEMFGFERELMVMYADYPKLEPRIFQAAEASLSEHPAKGRVEPLVYVLMSSADNLETIVRDHLLDSSQTRIVVPVDSRKLESSGGNSYFMRNVFRAHLYSRDLFDVAQPVESDLYFFGRQSTVVDLLEGLRRGRNYGVFGLRKTGKTSLLLKLKRTLEESQQGKLVYLDLQDAALYRLNWWKLLDEVCAKATNAPHLAAASADEALRKFRALVHSLPRDRTLVIALDEIEHITPGIRMESHWDRDFLDFWKTLRAIQNENRHIAVVVAGVNASVIETPVYGGHDNPLFAMAQVRYVPAFSRADVRTMVRTLGKSMGLKFEEDVYDYLLAHYGGHPALTRMACSHMHQHSAADIERPVSFDLERARRDEVARDRSLLSVGEHILGLLRRWYPGEYSLLEHLASERASEFAEMSSASPHNAEHLRAYGLVEHDSEPRLRISLLRDCLTNQNRWSQHSNALEDDLTEVGALRNRLEPLLRTFVKRTLKLRFGPERWIDHVLKVVLTSEREKLNGVDKDVILSQRIFLLNLITVIEQNWDWFKGLEACPQDRKVTKAQFSVLLAYVNAHREDAHAKEVSAIDLATLRVVVRAVESSIRYLMQD